MPYIGKSPVGGGFHKLDSLTASATATYALTLGGAAYYPETANQLLVSLNGVIQAPQDSFTVSGSNLVFASALTASDSIDFVVALGDVLGVQGVTDGTVTTAKIANNAVTMDKLATSGTLPALDGSALTGLFSSSQVIAQLSMSADDTDITEQQWNRATFDVIDFDNYASTANVAKTSGVQSGAGFLVPVSGYYQIYFNVCIGHIGADATTRDSGALISKYTSSTETILASTHGRYSGNDLGDIPHFLSVIENLQANDEVIFRHYMNNTAGAGYDIFAQAANDASHAWYPSGSSDNSAMKRGTYCGIMKVG